MNKYESIIIVNPNVDEAGLKALEERYTDIFLYSIVHCKLDYSQIQETLSIYSDTINYDAVSIGLYLDIPIDVQRFCSLQERAFCCHCT